MKVAESNVRKKGVLIIEGHVQGLSNARSLGENGIPVYVTDKGNCIARYSKYCKNYFRCPDYNSDELAYFLLELAKARNLTGWLLLPSNDHAVYTISKHKEQLEEYYKVITPDLVVLENIYDKSKLLKIAQYCDIPVPGTYYFQAPDDINSVIRYPFLC